MHVTIRVTIQTAILATEYEKHFEKKFEVVVKELLALSGKINVVFENTVLYLHLQNI